MTKSQSNTAAAAAVEQASAATRLALTATETATKLATATAETATKLAVETAVMAKNIDSIKIDVSEVKQTLKELFGVFVTKIEFTDVSKIQVDHESRIRVIEANMWKWLGMSSVIASLVAIIVAYLMKVLV